MPETPNPAPDQNLINNLTDKPNGGLDLNAKVTQTVNGTQVTKTVAEWLVDANKASGAEAQFQAAADARKVAQAVDVLNNEQATPTQKAEAQRLLLKRGGKMTDADIEQYIQSQQAPPAPARNDGTGNSAQQITQTLAGVQGQIGSVTDQLGMLWDERLDQSVEQVLSTDNDLKVYLGTGAPEGRRAEIEKQLREKAILVMQTRSQVGEKYQPKWIAEALTQVKPEVLKHAQRVIGEPPKHLGRSPETMLGSEVANLLDKTPMPKPGAQRGIFQDYITGELGRGVMAEENSQSARLI